MCSGERVVSEVRTPRLIRAETTRRAWRSLVPSSSAKGVLRDYINATIGFEELGDLTEKSPKSLMRMLRPRGNPRARNLFEIIGCLLKREGLHFEVRAVR